MQHYLDNAATTKVCPEAVAAMVDMMETEYGNPSSTHSMGLSAERRLNGARRSVAAALACSESEVYFTSGGTEADNWALIGAATAGMRQGRHIITSAIEHEAVLNTAAYLVAQGFELTILTANEDGTVDTGQLKAALRPDTILVSVMLVNNETGVVQPFEEIASIVRRSGAPALLHCDAVQGFMKLPFTPTQLGADLVTVSGHKIHGPKGAGALYIRGGVKLPPLIHGGGQERGLRSGTEGLPQIVGFGAACEAALKDFNENRQRMAALRERAVAGLTRIDGLSVLPAAAPHILSFSAPGYRSEVMMNFLESRNVFVSKGSACKKGKRSHVLEAMKLPPKVIDSTVRASLSAMSTEADVDALCSAVREATSSLVRGK